MVIADITLIEFYERSEIRRILMYNRYYIHFNFI